MSNQDAKEMLLNIGQTVENGKAGDLHFVKSSVQTDEAGVVDSWVDAFQTAINYFLENAPDA
jgi:hypothetical protein